MFSHLNNPWLLRFHLYIVIFSSGLSFKDNLIYFIYLLLKALSCQYFLKVHYSRSRSFQVGFVKNPQLKINILQREKENMYISFFLHQIQFLRVPLWIGHAGSLKITATIAVLLISLCRTSAPIPIQYFLYLYFVNLLLSLGQSLSCVGRKVWIYPLFVLTTIK